MFIQIDVTISKNCTNGQDINYEVVYTTDSGTLIATCNVSGTECSNGRCSHVLRSNTVANRCQPPVSQFSGENVTVSVTASNIVGRNNSAMSRSISEFSEGSSNFTVVTIECLSHFACLRPPYNV